MRLSELSRRATAVVDHVEDREPADPISQRLRELGFVTGEVVRVVAVGPFGGDPLVVQVGFTRFALRRQEAARVRVRAEAATQPAAPAANVTTTATETAPPAQVREAA
ncbi:iron transporter FeoA [Ralstonia sp. A12]|uniref:FeoA family protein n=1 Tax=unclassified Ralstonia TaxID=209769 RepID=UPI000575D79F|nr:ferrous iron transport protein A [Ralstonia sp. A12]KHK55728.1 iron transporter FeoA [Ralstonia sp. A12]